ncbi:unnamed protein product, partial [Laminaria digitata]
PSRSPALLFFSVEVHEKLPWKLQYCNGSLQSFHGNFHYFHGSKSCFHGIFRGSCGSFHGGTTVCRSFHTSTRDHNFLGLLPIRNEGIQKKKNAWHTASRT